MKSVLESRTKQIRESTSTNWLFAEGKNSIKIQIVCLLAQGMSIIKWKRDRRGKIFLQISNFHRRPCTGSELVTLYFNDERRLQFFKEF